MKFNRDCPHFPCFVLVAFTLLKYLFGYVVVALLAYLKIRLLS